MTIGEVLERADALRPNAYTKAEKIAWLNAVEARLYAETVLLHEGGADYERGPYTVDTPQDTQLLFKTPHDELYLYYLFMQMDLHNQELVKYNNDSQLFNSLYRDAVAAYTREVRPLQRVTHFRM